MTAFLTHTACATEAALPPLPADFESLAADDTATDASIPPKPETPPALAPAPTAAEPEPLLEGPPVPLAPPRQLGRDHDDGKPITLDLKNADLGATLHSFARFTGINIIASEKVRG